MKRVLAILMALVMLFSFAACTISNDDEDTAKTYEYTTGYDETKYNAPGTLPVFKEKQTIEVMLPDSQYVQDWDTNRQTVMMEEDLNAELVLEVLPSGEYNTKINLMAASGGEEFKDVILGGFSDGMVINLAESDVILPITEYMYNTDIAYYSNEAKERLGWDYYPYITMLDGEIYGLPDIVESLGNTNKAKMWVYKPWFDAAGIDIKDIHTTEDFKNALLTVVKSDPNGNGKADEVGLTAKSSSFRWFDFLMNAFVYAGQDNFIYVKDGKLGFAYQTEEWKEGLKYIKELCDLGLIDPLALSQDTTSYKSMLNYTDTIVTAFVETGADYIDAADKRRIEYEAISPLNSKWNDGKPLSSQSLTTPRIDLLISKNATDPETAFRFGDIMMCEKFSVQTRYGEKGVDWLEPSENDVSLYAPLGYDAYMVSILPWSTVQNQHWYCTGPLALSKDVTAGIAWSGNPLDHMIRVAEAQAIYEGTGPEEDIVKLIYTPEEDEIVADGLSSLTDYVEQMSAKFILGKEDIDEGWEAFQSQIKSMNAEGVLECAQTAYDRMQAIAG